MIQPLHFLNHQQNIWKYLNDQRLKNNIDSNKNPDTFSLYRSENLFIINRNYFVSKAFPKILLAII